MSQNIMAPETLEHALAETQQQDERDREYWHDRINNKGWTIHLGDEHSIGLRLPYAMAAIEVHHIQGDDCFHSARHDRFAALSYPIIVFADELEINRHKPLNRQSDGNTYVYALYPADSIFPIRERDYAGLPTGRYILSVMVPLFKTEAVVLKRAHGTGYRVSTALGCVYDSDELEEGRGFMGLCQAVTSFAPRGFVWKLIKKTSSIKEFEVEMANRGWAFWGAEAAPEVDDEAADDNPELENKAAVRAWLDDVEGPDADVKEDAAASEMEGLEAEDVGTEDVKESIAWWAVEHSDDGTTTEDTADSSSGSNDSIVVKEELDSDDDNAHTDTTSSAESEYYPAVESIDLSNKRKRSRHDADELWVERGGKRMKF